MKVALINDFLPNTGIGNYGFSLFSELQKMVDVEMLYLDCCKEMKESNRGTRVIRNSFPFPFLNKSLNNYFFFPKKVPEGYDVYHLADQYLSNIALSKKPCIITCLDLIPFFFCNGYNPIVSFFWRKQMSFLEHADKIICISEFTKNELLRAFNISEEKATVIHLGVDLENFKPVPKEFARKKLGLCAEEPVVLNVGAEDKRKNVETALRAFALVKKQYPNIQMLRVGESRNETKKLIRELGLQESVKYLQSISKQELALVYNAADLLLFCSVYEGFGLPVLEAMACNTAIIAANAASVPEVAGNAALLVDAPFSEQQFEEAILDVLEKPALRKRLGAKGLERARRFSWRNCAEKTVKLYREVLS